MATLQRTDWEVTRMDSGRPVKKILQLIRQEMMVSDNGATRVPVHLLTAMFSISQSYQYLSIILLVSQTSLPFPLSLSKFFTNQFILTYYLLYLIIQSIFLVTSYSHGFPTKINLIIAQSSGTRKTILYKDIVVYIVSPPYHTFTDLKLKYSVQVNILSFHNSSEAIVVKVNQ